MEERLYEIYEKDHLLARDVPIDCVENLWRPYLISEHPECLRCFENGLDLWRAEIKKGQAYCKRCGQKVIWDND